MKTRLFLTLTALLLALSSWAAGTEIDGIHYELNSRTGTASVTYTGSSSDYNPSSTAYTGGITIPASVTYGGTTYSVTSIGNYAFYNCTGLTSITIPSSVTSIGDDAFYGCTGLTSVNIPNSVTKISNYAFEKCTGLTSVNIPNSVTKISIYAFSGCTGLTSITIPSSVTSIGIGAFSGCTGLTSIKVEAGNTKYDSRNNCNAIIETASKTLVAGCKTTTIPSSVTSIGSAAFRGCTGLTSITIPSSVTSIGVTAFYGCTGLTSITIPNSVTSIGEWAFSVCTGLTSVTIPSSVTSIGKNAFNGCTGLTSITIPSSVTSIGESAFSGCTGLTSVTLNSNTIASKTYTSSSSLSSIFGNQVKEYILGDEIQSIGSYAFYNCSGLTSVTIPSSITSIGERTFYGCSGLTSITIPSSVTSIGSGAFAGCTGLTSIKVEAGNTKYDSRDNCNAIIETASNTLVAGCKTTTIPSSVRSIGESAFSGCTGLTSITIPSSVTSIGDYAFSVCTSLTSITIPSSVTTIGGWAFMGCSGLTSITIPNSVTTIGSQAFRGCTGLTSITIPSSVTSIYSSAFSGCTGLTSITIPSSVTSIGNDAFYGCTGLTSITIPSSVTSIGGYAFCDCTGLTSITIPNSVTSIGERAFYDCTGLTSIILSWDDPTNCTYGSSMLDDVPTSATLYVPAGTKALYENTEPWSRFKNIVERENSVITLNNTMGTYCDASGLDFSNVEGLEAYTATGYASGEVTLTRVNYVPANTGIVLRGTPGVYEVPKQKVSAYLTNLLKGTTSPITLNQTEGDMTNYILANGSKGIGFYKVASGGGTLAANKAYLQLPSNLSATRPMMLRFEDEYGQTTDIQYLYTSSDDETAPAIFDLQGRRVNGTMQHGGIYIVGGKKVIAK